MRPVTAATGAGAVFTAILAIVCAILAAIAGMNKAQNAVWRNGLPYCPACGRQISLKSSRPYCRSCGYNLVQPARRSAPTPAAPSNAELLARGAERKRRVQEQVALEELTREIERARQREADAEREARELAMIEKEAKRRAAIEDNGGSTDLQLLGFGAAIVVIPAVIAALLIYAVTR